MAWAVEIYCDQPMEKGEGPEHTNANTYKKETFPSCDFCENVFKFSIKNTKSKAFIPLSF